jgi:hypothetical protein
LARHATQRDACVSGKLRNDDDGLIWPTIVPEARLGPCRRRVLDRAGGASWTVPEARLGPCRRRVFNMTGRFFTPAGRRYASLVVGSDHGVKPAWPADVKNRSNGSI